MLALWKVLLREWKGQAAEWQEIFSQCILIKDGIQKTISCLNSAGRKQVVQLENGSSKHIMEELCVSEISI